MLSGWVLHLVQVADRPLFVPHLYSCRRGQCPQRSWARVIRLCVFWGEGHLECCLVVCLPSVGPLVWSECILLGLSYLVKGYGLIYNLVIRDW